MSIDKYSKRQQSAAWLVHLYTAIGGILGFAALVLAVEEQYASCFLLLLLSMVIDATDGMMARKLQVSSRLPNFSGDMLDNVIDIFTYAWIPVLIMYKLNVLANPVWLILPIIASLFAYGQVNMKTEDAFFLGFPTYWNIVALYFFLLKPSPEVAAALLMLFAVLSFIPTRYLYVSKNNYLWRTTWTLGAIWIAMVCYLLIVELNPTLALISVLFPIYYFAASFYADFRIRTGHKLT